MAAQQGDAIANVIQEQVLKAAQIIEERLDEEIKALDDLKSDDIEKLREKRLLQLKREAKKRQEYLAKVTGHFLLNGVSKRSIRSQHLKLALPSNIYRYLFVVDIIIQFK